MGERVLPASVTGGSITAAPLPSQGANMRPALKFSEDIYDKEGGPSLETLHTVLGLTLSGLTFGQIAKREYAPSLVEMTAWLIDHPWFRTAYREAQQARAEVNLGDMTASGVTADDDPKRLGVKLKINLATTMTMGKLIAAERTNPVPMTNRLPARDPKAIDITSIHDRRDDASATRGEYAAGTVGPTSPRGAGAEVQPEDAEGGGS